MIRHEYEIADLSDLSKRAGRDIAVDVQEDRGRILFRVSDRLSPAQVIEALNAASEQVLAGGHWMQEWKGDIVTRDAPAQKPSAASEFEAGPHFYVFRRASAA